MNERPDALDRRRRIEGQLRRGPASRITRRTDGTSGQASTWTVMRFGTRLQRTRRPALGCSIIRWTSTARGGAPDRAGDHRPDRDRWAEKWPVHDVHVDPVGAADRDCGDLVAQAAEIGERIDGATTHDLGLADDPPGIQVVYARSARRRRRRSRRGRGVRRGAAACRPDPSRRAPEVPTTNLGCERAKASIRPWSRPACACNGVDEGARPVEPGRPTPTKDVGWNGEARNVVGAAPPLELGDAAGVSRGRARCVHDTASNLPPNGQAARIRPPRSSATRGRAGGLGSSRARPARLGSQATIPPVSSTARRRRASSRRARRRRQDLRVGATSTIAATSCEARH